MIRTEGKKRSHIFRNTLIVFLGVLLLFSAVFAVYVSDGYYNADETARAVLEDPPAGVTVTEDPRGNLVFAPEAGGAPGDSTLRHAVVVTGGVNGKSEGGGNEGKEGDPIAHAGLIFYPGGKVEYKAYAPLMCRLARGGLTCILVKMPFDLAFLKMNAADEIREQHPEITDWYIGGHSLGGVTAALYLADHADGFRGLILMGAYSVRDLSDTDLRVLSLYGSEDKIFGRDRYETNRGNLPADFTEYVIEGGCHAYFGSYGAQKGDGTPVITPEEQQEETAEAVLAWIDSE